jgi:3-carboxy-cis,cis-muconate cycloisomerase
MHDDLNSFLFTTPEMTLVFSSEAQLRAMMRFEWALTCALEKHSLSAAASGAVLLSMLGAAFIDIDALQREARDAGNIAIPFVRQLTAAVRTRSEPASRAIHLGATSQDVLDTATVLQIRDATALLDKAIDRLDAALVEQVRAYAGTLMTGRTWLQPGPPTTLGLKLAGALAALRRDRDRIRTAAQRALVLQFGGAVGTLASLGANGGTVSAELARILELREPELPWHTQRDRFAEIVQVLAILTGTLAKFARDIALLMQAEIAEASEGGGEGRGSSSTMPHKHNPVACAAVLAAHARMPGLAATMLQAMPQEHERGLGLWQAEWETIPAAFRLASAALAYSIEIAEGLEVNAARMQANFDALFGTSMSEAVSAALAQKIGRAEAHALLREAADRARRENRRLREVLQESAAVIAHLTPDEIDRLMNPREYLGRVQRFIAQVLGD